MTATCPPATSVMVVHSPACHFCNDAEAGLAELADDFPLVIERIEAAHPHGEALLREHRAPMYPLVLVDGAFFSFGRLPRKKLRKLLAQRYPVAVA